MPAWFDPHWYVHRYADIRDYPEGALLHFFRHGAREVRHPSPFIDLARIFDRHPGLQAAPIEDIFEAIGHAVADAPDAVLPRDEASFRYLVETNGLFDEAWYLAQNRDVSVSGQAPIDHFIRHGAVENRDPGPGFDSDFYRSEHPEFVEESRTAIEHFVRIGLRRGDPGVGRPAYARWVERFDTLTPADLVRIAEDARPDTPPVLAFHVVDAAAATAFAPILAAWRSQIGSRCKVAFVRSACLDEETWACCREQIDAAPGCSVFDVARGLADLTREAVVLLCSGAVVVRPHAACMFEAAFSRPAIEAAYADHDHLDEDGQRVAPRFKPAMSPEFMRHVPYAGELVAVRLRPETRGRIADLLTEAATGGAGAERWARELLDAPRGSVAHVPFVLFHSTPAASAETTPSASSVGSSGGASRPLPDLGDPPSVTLIIPTRDRVELLRACLDSIEGGTDDTVDRRAIVVVDNGSEDRATLAYLAELAGRRDVTVVPVPGPFNFARLCNAGAARATGQVLVFLNNDTTVLRPDWLGRLVAYARQPDVGVVGAHLLFPDDATQHGGVVLGVQGVGAHRLKPGALGPAGAVTVTRELVTVTGACLAIRREVFAEFGGFDPVLGVAFNDVKLCASAHEAGYRNIYVGEPLLHHHESKSRGFDLTLAQRRRNTREAIYVRERFGALFRADPSYSPNLSLQEVDKLGVPPRVVRPWRRTRPGEPRRVLLLCYQHSQGQGVATVLEQQALFLRDRGWEVFVGGPQRPGDLAYAGCRRVSLWTPEAAAAFAVAEGIDCVVAHTPPFFSVTRYLGAEPLAYFTDHGEPPAQLFDDREAREDVDWEKRFCAALARRVFAISQTVLDAQHRADAVLIRNGNSHLASWSEAWAERRGSLRDKFGFGDSFVVLKVCRFGPAERVYKGVVRYGEVASDLPYRHPELHGRVRFVLVGRGDADDVAAVESMGLEARANVTDAELIELYVASDLYMSFSEWEGYNLGIGQALAMGLDAVASDIGAHREFGIEVSDSVAAICDSVGRRYARRTAEAAGRTARVQPWATSLALMAETLDADLREAEAARNPG